MSSNLFKGKFFIGDLSYTVNQFHLNQISPTGNFNKMHIDVLLL